MDHEGQQYVLAILLSTNLPWNEAPQEEPFLSWAARVFSEGDAWLMANFMDTEELCREDEYVTAYPTKANSHPLMKHPKGFDADPESFPFPYHPSPCVKLILRNVRTVRKDLPPVILQTKPLSPDQFWCAVRTTWLPGLSARRDSMMRSHPDTLDRVLAPGQRALHSLREFVDGSLAQVRQDLATTAGGRGRRGRRPADRQECTNLICMQKLLMCRPALPPGLALLRKSTLWNPAEPRRNLITAADILTSRCSCAIGAKFHFHLSVDCPGGLFAFTPTTYFEREEQVIPAMLHAAKGRLLSSLRASPVNYDSLVRVTADSDAPEFLRVVATYSNFRTDDYAGQRSTEPDEHGTDKHRVLWLLSLSL